MRRLLLVRHGEVHPRWQPCCYGASDVGLNSRGRSQSKWTACRLADENIGAIYSSDLRRARFLADNLSRRVSLPVIPSKALRERDFGAWEQVPWDEIHATTGNAMDGMISAPDVWRPPGGETTFELRDRVLTWFHWYETLPSEGTTVAVTHGGPIAALLGTLRNLPVSEWPALVPPWGSVVEARREGG